MLTVQSIQPVNLVVVTANLATATNPKHFVYSGLDKYNDYYMITCTVLLLATAVFVYLPKMMRFT